MTLYSDLLARGQVIVGSGGGASAAYPILSISESVVRSGAHDSEGGEAFVETTWNIESIAQANTNALVGALNETLQASLGRRGHQVTITEAGGAARVMPAENVANGSLPGYPRVTVNCKDEALTVGAWQRFSLSCVTRRPASYLTPVHTYERTVTTDEAGLITTRQSGEVTTPPGYGQTAAAWIEQYVFEPARQQANINELIIETEVRSRSNTSHVAYTYRVAPPSPGQFGSASPAGITRGEVNDRTVFERAAGARRRTISGYFEGPGASAAAEGVAGSIPPTTLIDEKEISQPRQPDGRVDFRYLVTDGIDAGNGVTLFDFQQSVDSVGGGRQVVAEQYDNANPTTYLGPVQAFIYQQTTTIRFRGLFANAIALITPAFSVANRSGKPVIRRGSDGNARTLSHTMTFVFDTEQTVPGVQEYFTTL